MIVAELMYILKRAKPDSAPAVPFLTTRVSGSDDDCLIKLRRIIEYMNGTVYILSFWNYTVLCKQIVNSKSSTEAELVTVNDCIVHATWLSFFNLDKGTIKPRLL